MITVSCIEYLAASRLDYLLFFLENCHWYFDIFVSSFFNAAIVPHPGHAVIGRILRVQINAVYIFLTHAHSKGEKISAYQEAKRV